MDRGSCDLFSCQCMSKFKLRKMTSELLSFWQCFRQIMNMNGMEESFILFVEFDQSLHLFVNIISFSHNLSMLTHLRVSPTFTHKAYYGRQPIWYAYSCRYSGGNLQIGQVQYALSVHSLCPCIGSLCSWPRLWQSFCKHKPQSLSLIPCLELL